MGVLGEIAQRIPLVLLSGWITLIIHEMGHVIIGLVYGWKLQLLVIGPIGIRREHDKLVFYFEKNIMAWGGMASVMPVNKSDNNIKVLPKILLGGPVASFVFGAIFLMMCYFNYNYFLFILGLMSIAIFLVNSMPMKNGFTYTDGKRWWRLKKGGQGAAEEIALYKLSEYARNKNISLMQPSEVEALLNAEHADLKYTGYYFLFQHYNVINDQENKQKTLNVLNSMEKDVSKYIINSYKL